MTIKEIQDSIVEDFSMFDDWMDRYAMLIEMGKECPIIDEKYRDEAHLINGCQSRVWLNAELRTARCITRPTATRSSPRVSLTC